ncbi:MAG: discoidin domain-containing protein [Tannerella sp.]|nr:discoidin domain-containing protein [Tannerella sp.]
MKQIISIFLLAFLSASLCFSQTEAQWRIIESSGYESEDVAVAAFTDADHASIDKTGTNNSRTGIQELLNRLGNIGGGTLYLSAGRYKVDGLLVIPKGVVLRGDWKQPQKDAPVEGTLLMAYSGRGTEDEASAFITMEPSTGLYDVAIWYPEQLPGNIVPYPPTILYGRQGVWGNEYCNVRNVTLVNSYSGVIVSRNNGGGCPNIFNLYGTPLSRGIEIDNIADVGRFDRIDFSPGYWTASGLPDAPAKGGAHEQYIRENATAVVMRRNDWSYTCHLSAEGYHTGFYAGQSKVANDTSKPNGHNYHFSFTDCTEAIRLDGVASVGMMFAHIRITDCESGIVTGEDVGGGAVAQFYDCEIDARKEAISLSEKISLKLMTRQCKIISGKVNINGGIYASVDGDFNNEPPQISTGTAARMILTGNRFAQPVEINDRSLFQSAIDHQPVSVKPASEFPGIKPRETKPAKNNLHVVTDSEFGAVADAVTDNTAALQNALDKAGNEGGGIVFLPPGKYRVNGNLTVPSGVELKGASDVASVPKGQGSIIEIYAGKNDPNGEPFLKLSEKSGIRGITFNYPEQRSSFAKNPATLPQYPYCMQATGSDVYIVNVGVRATYQGIDLFTHPCDNHYVDYFAGHVFKNAMRIGGGSTGGLVSNTQFNSIVMAYGYEDPKFGAWPNSDSDQASRDAVYDQNWKELEFMILEDCKDQLLYNNFHYASHRGIIFGKNGTAPSGISMGLGLDASLRSICFEGLDADKGFDLINTQVVSVARDLYADTKFIETSPDFTGEAYLFNSDYWGNARYAGVFGGGTVNLVVPHFEQYGSLRFLEITGGANINISTGDVNASNFVAGGKTGQVSVESSVVAPSSPPGYRSWRNNLTTAPVLRPQATLPRNGWIATANISNASPNNAIDGRPDTRWDTSASQYPGQWFAVDTRQPNTFNTVILDASGSPDDWPAAYAVYVSGNGIDWGNPIATGTQQSAVVIINLPVTTARHVKIIQTGSGKTLYWSIHEFYLALLETTAVEQVRAGDMLHLYLAGKRLYISGNEQLHAAIGIYNIAGQLVRTGSLSENGISVENLPAGIYIVVLQSGDKTTNRKIIIN